MRQNILSLLTLGGLISSACAQCPNTVAVNHPNLRTASENATWFLVPVPDATAAKLTRPFKLVPVDKTLLPGFPAGQHPLLVSVGLQNDIRMSVAAITSLLTASIYVPFTDRLGDGKTAFNTPSRNFLGGFNGQDLMALVPATVATLAEGTTAEVATFDPNDSAYKSGAPNVFSNDVKDVIIENPISGPSIEPAAIDFLFSTAAKSPYPASSFHTILNQPIILDNGFCQRNTYLFNESFAEPAFRTGNVTLYSPPDPSGVAGVHTNEAGYSACGEIIGFNPETCATAAARNTIGNN